MDDQVLKNIKRTNIRYSDYLEVQSKLKEIDPNYNSQAEMIIPLPGETKETFFAGVGRLVNAGVSKVEVYTLMMLEGTELNTEEIRRSSSYTVKWRIIPRSYSEFESVKCIETEEVGVATKDMPFEDYISCRKLSLVLQCIYNSQSFVEIIRFLEEKDIDIFDWINRCHGNIEDYRGMASVVKSFINETVSELWDTEEEMLNFYSKDNNFRKLLDGEHGANLLQKYWVEGVIYNFEQLTDFVIEMTKELLSERNIFNEVTKIELDALRTWTLVKRADVFTVSVGSKYRLFDLSHDIQGWMQDDSGKTLEHFQFESTAAFNATLSSTVQTSLEELRQRFGTDHQAMGKISTRINAKNFEREIRFA